MRRQTWLDGDVEVHHGLIAINSVIHSRMWSSKKGQMTQRSSMEFGEWKISQQKCWDSKKGYRTSGELAVALAEISWAVLTKISRREDDEAVEAEAGGVKGAAELEEEGVGAAEEAVDGGVVARGNSWELTMERASESWGRMRRGTLSMRETMRALIWFFSVFGIGGVGGRRRRGSSESGGGS